MTIDGLKMDRSLLVPTTDPGQVLIRVAGVGVCGSDPSMQRVPQEAGRLLRGKTPFTLGHETGGWIEQVSEGVKGFEKDEAVVLVSQNSCGGLYLLPGKRRHQL